MLLFEQGSGCLYYSILLHSLGLVHELELKESHEILLGYLSELTKINKRIVKNLSLLKLSKIDDVRVNSDWYFNW